MRRMKYVLATVAAAALLYALAVGLIALAVSRRWIHAAGDPDRTILDEWWRGGRPR